MQAIYHGCACTKRDHAAFRQQLLLFVLLPGLLLSSAEGLTSMILMNVTATLLLLLQPGLCPEHMKVDAMRLKSGGDQLWRFCQQVSMPFLQAVEQCLAVAAALCAVALVRTVLRAWQQECLAGQPSRCSCKQMSSSYSARSSVLQAFAQRSCSSLTQKRHNQMYGCELVHLAITYCSCV
jgi:hypothetical protein